MNWASYIEPPPGMCHGESHVFIYPASATTGNPTEGHACLCGATVAAWDESEKRMVARRVMT